MRHRRSVALILAVIVLLVCVCAGQQQQSKPVTNADVVQMVKAGLGESTILLTIQHGPTAFDTSPAALVELKKAGVSAAVMDTMLKASSLASSTAAVPALPFSQSSAPPQIKDPAESSAYLTAVNQSDVTTKAQQLEAFLTQFPNTVVKVSALESLMATYLNARNAQKAIDTANRLLQADPNNLRGLALLTYTYRQRAEAGGPNAAQTLQQAAQYAQKGLQAIETLPTPADVTPGDWEKLKTQTQVIFAGAAGMAALQQKDYTNAQRYLATAVQSQPNDLRNVYPLALAYLQQTPLDVRGLWYIARAVGLAAGTPAQTPIANYGMRAYTGYHGSDHGWNELVDEVKNTSVPPPNFTIVAAYAGSTEGLTSNTSAGAANDAKGMVPIQDFVVVQAGGSGEVGHGRGGCWLHVSNGTTIYAIQSLEPGLHLPGATQNCFQLPVGAHVQGAVGANHLALFVPTSKDKTKRITYKIVQVADAKTNQ